MTQTSNAELLHPRIVRYLSRLGWTRLNEIQEKAVPAVLGGGNDVIISAGTAAGKTEAAFLPVCTALLRDPPEGVGALYISPLKALINDQYRRMEALGSFAGIRVTPWHGDIGANVKKKIFSEPAGIALITPESLESLLINYPAWYRSNLAGLRYVIVDEFHAFIGTERGYQLLSQMHRLETALGRRIPRIALSATLNDIGEAARWLRADAERRPVIVEARPGGKTLFLQLRGYETGGADARRELSRLDPIAADLFRLLRGSTNLVFANSRAKTEYLATRLGKLSAAAGVPPEFFPHHGSLSKDLRERLENRLKAADLPTTAICTQTLELGIDIGEAASIAQVDAPSSVAGLRQRIGRAGRRDRAAVLRLFITEQSREGAPLPLGAELREETFLSAAVLELVLENWYEPPAAREYAMSTLIQQILSVIAETGSAGAPQLWRLLCETGPFSLITRPLFAGILRSMGRHDLIIQMRDGKLTLGPAGEKVVSRFSFYSSFRAREEYAVEHNGAHIGTTPLSRPLAPGDTFLFAGKGWEVVYFSGEKRIISVRPCRERAEPLPIDGRGARIHDGVREKMFELYTRDDVPAYLDKTARRHFAEGRAAFARLGLAVNRYAAGLDGLYVFPWKGDRIADTLVQLFRSSGIQAKKFGCYLLLPDLTPSSYARAVRDILAGPAPTEAEMAGKITGLECDKFDVYLDRELLCVQYGNRNFDVAGAVAFLETALRAERPFNPANRAAYAITSGRAGPDGRAGR